MLRITGLSLLLGFAAVVVTLYLLFLPPDVGRPAGSSLHWEITPGDEVNPQSIALDENGVIALTFPQRHFEAKQFAYFQLALQNLSSELPHPSITLNWQSSSEPGQTRSFKLETNNYQSLWLATRELRGWEKTITDFSISLSGSPDQELEVERIALHAPKLQYQLRAIQSDLTGFVSWNRSSMNSYTGAQDTSSFYPTILFTIFWLASSGVYLLLCICFRHIRFQWEVVGLVTLCAWIALDITWQTKLLKQAAHTRDNFAGKSTTEKLMVGPDAQLYQFVHAAKTLITEDNARVFAASSDDYTGLRAAYYLYPYNAFWSLRGSEIPHRRFLRSGDYIALLKPNTSENDLHNKLLVLPGGKIAVEALLSMPAGTLVRVP
ncbi:MAG: hypothetical protein AB8C02_13775 [Halioglobus sp.]